MSTTAPIIEGGAYQNPGWYVIRTSLGYVGYILHRKLGKINPGSKFGTVTGAVQITTDTSQPIYNVDQTGAITGPALHVLGASDHQIQNIIAQLDAGAGKSERPTSTNVNVGPVHLKFGTDVMGILTLGLFGGGAQQSTTQLLIDPHGTPSASQGTQKVPTKLTGDTSSSTPNPSVSIATGWGFLQNVSFWKGVGLVIGGAVILIFAGLEFKNLAV